MTEAVPETLELLEYLEGEVERQQTSLMPMNQQSLVMTGLTHTEYEDQLRNWETGRFMLGHRQGDHRKPGRRWWHLLFRQIHPEIING